MRLRPLFDIRGRALATLLLVASLAPFASQARTLEEIKAKGSISMCANPDALPYASAKADPPGFQIEIGRAIAQGLGVSLDLAWINNREQSREIARSPSLRSGDCGIVEGNRLGPVDGGIS